jgi:hypothetical protein
VTEDGFLRRLEWTAIVVCLAMAIVGLVLSRGQPSVPAAVIAGGFLSAFSYRTIGAGIAPLGTAPAGHTAPRVPPLAWTLVKVIVRYALLALLAYVMIARLRLHPLGLLAGASSVVVAASVEAVRLLLKKS